MVRMTTAEAAGYLNITASALRYWRQNNSGPAYRKYGRHVRYAKEDLDKFDELSKVSN